jgi:hypothetical protein
MSASNKRCSTAGSSVNSFQAKKEGGIFLGGISPSKIDPKEFY